MKTEKAKDNKTHFLRRWAHNISCKLIINIQEIKTQIMSVQTGIYFVFKVNSFPTLTVNPCPL